VDRGRAWIDWQGGGEQVLQCILPVPGLELYVNRGGFWFRLNHCLPARELPSEGNREPLAAALVPAPVDPEPPPQSEWQASRLRLVRDCSPRSTSAMLCEVRALADWATMASSLQITSIEAALLEDRVLLVGNKLPLLAGATRFWGRRLLVPLGYSVWPALPEGVLCEALGATAHEVIVLGKEAAEVVPRSAFQQLSRAAIRLAHKSVDKNS